ncbi:hypothetical protein [Dactylosporangium darangshiense]|uniref:UspA domain-containing protein n=1 Tax=Dactylosporangium darangshiense TaxID=579108 RepID=A0ABP8DEY1_9ACTN
MQTDGNAGRPDTVHSKTGAPPPQPRVCVIVDDRECGVAAVRHAAALVAGGARPLMVLMRQRSHLSEALASAQGIVVPGAKSLRVNTTFRLVAAALAESGAPWEFHALDEGGAALVTDVPTTLVYAAHRRGHVWLPLPWPGSGSPGIKVIDRAGTSLVPVRCDRRRRQRQPKEHTQR